MHTTSFVAAVHISAFVSAPDFASVSPCCSILLLFYIHLSLSSTSHIYVLDIVGPLHFLLTLLTNFLIMFARWHISLSAYFYIVRASADGLLELYAVSVDGMGSISRICICLLSKRFLRKDICLIISLGAHWQLLLLGIAKINSFILFFPYGRLFIIKPVCSFSWFP